MKKILALLFAAILTLALTSTVLAVEFYLDYTISGAVNNTGYYEIYDDFTGEITDGCLDNESFSQMTLGVEIPFWRFKIGIEYAAGRYSMGPDGYFNSIGLVPEDLDITKENYDMSGYDLRFGYALMDETDYQCYITLGYMNRAIDGLFTWAELDSDLYNLYDWDLFYLDMTIAGFMLGVDWNYKFDDQMFIQAGAAFSINGSFEMEGISEYYGDVFDADGDVSAIKYFIKFGYLFTDHFSVTLGYHSNSFDLEDFSDNITVTGFSLGVDFKF